MATSCKDCRHEKVCMLVRMAEAGVESFNAQTDVMKFPFDPAMLALTCPKFETEEDVVKLHKSETPDSDKLENGQGVPLKA